MEDETGIANVIVTPDLYERERPVVIRSKFIFTEGPLRNQDGVIHVKATHLQTFFDQTLEVRLHDFLWFSRLGRHDGVRHTVTVSMPHKIQAGQGEQLWWITK